MAHPCDPKTWEVEAGGRLERLETERLGVMFSNFQDRQVDSGPNLGQKGREREKKVEEGDRRGNWKESPPPPEVTLRRQCLSS